MAKGFDISISGIPEVKSFLKNKNKKIGIKIQTGIKKSAIFLQGQVKTSIAGRSKEQTSVDTGRFLNSVDFNLGFLEASVFSPLNYAKFLEFGTSKIGARRHFKNSAARSSARINKIIATEVKKI